MPVDKTLADRYARALFMIAQKQNSIAVVEQELHAVQHSVRENRAFKKLLGFPNITITEKQAIVERIYGKQVSKLTLNFIGVLLQKGRIAYLDPITEKFLILCSEAQGRIDARVTTVFTLAADTQDKIRKFLSDLLHKQITLSIASDPSMLGGIRIQLGDKVLDGSVAYSLKKLKESLSI